MSDLYRHTGLAARMRQLGTIDRFVRTAQGTLEHVLSLSVQTSMEGVISVMMTMDMVLDGKETLSTVPIAAYPMGKQPDANADAWLVSQKLNIDMRRATTGIGWECVRLSDEDAKKLVVSDEFKV